MSRHLDFNDLYVMAFLGFEDEFDCACTWHRWRQFGDCPGTIIG
jgi:hypothetical protein